MDSRDAANVANYETVWLDANRFYEAESRYYESTVADRCKKANPGKVEPSVNATGMSQSSLANEIAHVRLKIQKCLTSGEGTESGTTLVTRLETLEKNNEAMKQTIEKLTSDMTGLLSRLSSMEKLVKQVTNQSTETQQSPKKEESKSNIQNGSSGAADDDDDIDLFGSDEEDDTAAKLREERLQAYANKKAKKPALVAKSSVVLDVKPWDDETDMKAMEKAVRAIESDGLVWGASKYVPLAYGIKKLQIIAIVEDEKVSIDWLQETICEIEDLVQSVDIAAFNKL